MTSKWKLISVLPLTAAILAGCGGGTEAEVRRWMDAEAKKMKGKVEPIAEPKPFIPFKYEADKQVDPFNVVKVVTVAQAERDRSKPGGGLKPPERPNKEVLELTPLENLRMVGILQQKGSTFALIRDNATLHRVKVGNYMGQNFGLITKIDESEVTLKELVQDATGDWVERISTMQLQEAGKK
jgi:type IV pilus assembly protein PilP